MDVYSWCHLTVIDNSYDVISQNDKKTVLGQAHFDVSACTTTYSWGATATPDGPGWSPTAWTGGPCVACLFLGAPSACGGFLRLLTEHYDSFRRCPLYTGELPQTGPPYSGGEAGIRRTPFSTGGPGVVCFFSGCPTRLRWG
jgi:hypothetical protein